MAKSGRIYRYDFRGHQGFPATASGVGTPWVIADTSSSGTPVFGGADAGGYAMTFDSQVEAQNLCLYFGDVLSFDADFIRKASFIIKTNQATLDTTTSIAWGMTSNRNDAIDTIAEGALFRVIGNNTVVVESDDGTNNNDDIATGLTLSTDWKRFTIDFVTGVFTQSPPALSLGRTSNVWFYGANANGSARRVASGTHFNMVNYSAGLQPFIQIQKTSDSNVDSVNILEVEIEMDMPNYS